MVSPALPSGFTFSQSSLQDYADCPRRFELRYIQHLRWPAVESEPALENEIHQQEGQLFHRLIQQLQLGIPAEKLAPLASSANLRRWWENYGNHPINHPGYAQHSELTLSVSLGNQFRLLAKYDLVVIKPGRDAVIYDWKTYAKRPPDERMATRWQTRVYRALLVKAGDHLNGGVRLVPEQVSMTYWYADYPSEPAHFRYNKGQFDRDWSGVEKIATEIASAATFPKTDDEQKCAYCVYRSFCERGPRAGEIEDPEAELSEPDINLDQIQEIAF